MSPIKEETKQKRVFERFNARFPVKFKHSRNDFGTDVFLRDASAEGIRVTTKERLFHNDSVSLEIKLPDGQTPLVLNGHVVWAKNKTSDLWDIGLKFHKVNFMKIQRLFKLSQQE